jgi:hypothetical protein
MQFIVKTSLSLSLLLLGLHSFSQSTYLPQNTKHQVLLDRLEIKMQRNADLNLSTAKPLSRKIAIRAAMAADSINQTNPGLLSNVDQYNLNSLYMNNPEWYTGDQSVFASKHPLFKTFYKSKANLVEVKEKDFFLVLNPVLQQQISKEKDNDETVFLNSKGLSFRGMIADRIGFSSYITDNQERGPAFMMEQVKSNFAVPGVGYFKTFKTTGVDYFDARGTIHFTAAKYLDFSFGYDKNFIGNGYRSLLLSDFSNSYLFLKINTRIRKLNYQYFFMELLPQFLQTNDELRDKKYAAVHHLSINATRWLNVGIFESVVFGRVNHFEFSYLNPIMFLRVAEHQNGSADNAIVGFDAKANIAKTVQLYSQLTLDELKLSEATGGEGWWGNKFGVQFGAKYIDAFKIKNLDLQAEYNVVRPYTYSHSDSVANYTHYNQPLAHPFGANFREVIGIIKYQPAPRWTASARLIMWQKGIDSGSVNYGGNIFKSYVTRPYDYGFKIPAGVKSTGVNAQFLLSFEPKENVYLDAAILVRRYKADAVNISSNTNMFTLGFRMNVFRREYDY